MVVMVMVVVVVVAALIVRREVVRPDLGAHKTGGCRRGRRRPQRGPLPLTTSRGRWPTRRVAVTTLDKSAARAPVCAPPTHRGMLRRSRRRSGLRCGRQRPYKTLAVDKTAANAAPTMAAATRRQWPQIKSRLRLQELLQGS
jgi:hypothetical protein